MTPTTTGRFRVFPGPDEDRWLFLSVEPDADGSGEAYDPTYVPTTGHGDLDEAVSALHPGYLVEATIEWAGDAPRIADLTVCRRTLFEFVDDATGIFDAAQETWAAAVAENEPMNSRVTYDTDGRPNGVLYVFAQQPGAQDLFEEFRSGVRPLEPLIDRIDAADAGEADGETAPEEVSLGPGGNLVVGDDGDDGDAAREVFVMRPADDPYVIVYIVLGKGSLLADTMRDTYHCPRPAED